MLIGFLAWLELLLESGPPGPKRVPHGRPVKQTHNTAIPAVVVYYNIGIRKTIDSLEGLW